MMNPEEIFREEIQLLKEELIAKHKALGMEASGKWIKALDSIIETTENNLNAVLKNFAYTEQLTQGREPGTFPPVGAIKQWIIDKPITPKDNISIDSLAWAISTKIFREGTDYYPDGTDLIDSVITPKRIKKIIDKVGSIFLNNFELEINEQLKRG